MAERRKTVTKSGEEVEVIDGSDIMELVENDKVFSTFVDHKFRDLDQDCDGQLSVKELQPAVADIGAALGLPAQGTSVDSDCIYSEAQRDMVGCPDKILNKAINSKPEKRWVLSEFTNGKDRKVSKTEFKKVLSDILLGMAAGLKRDPVVILRIDGEDLLEFITSPSFVPEMAAIFSEIDLPNGSLVDYINKAFEKLTVDKGMPPVSDSWVASRVIEPVLHSCGVIDEQPVSQDMFLEEFKRVAHNVAERLKEHPVIVAHSENTFDGTGIKRLLSNKFELEKILDTAVNSQPKNNGKISKDCLRLALDLVAPSAGLPPFGAVPQIDKVIGDSCKMLDVEDGKSVKEDEFKKLLLELLGSIMLQLEGDPISVSTNSVVHEPLTSASTLFLPSSP